MHMENKINSSGDQFLYILKYLIRDLEFHHFIHFFSIPYSQQINIHVCKSIYKILTIFLHKTHLEKKTGETYPLTSATKNFGK